MTSAAMGLDSPRPSTSILDRRPVRATAAALLLAALAGCSPAPVPSSTPGATGGPTTAPTPPAPTPTAAPTTAGLEHPTGAKDIVLRFEESGGFVPMEHNATYAPSFTLYGDGTVVFRDPYAIPPESTNNVQLSVPFQIVKLDEAGIQALLERALNEGGIAVAAGPYGGGGFDIPTSTFTMNLGGESKQVSLTGLSPDLHPENQAIVTQLVAFAETLANFGDVIAGEAPYLPEAYRAVLIEVEQPFGPVVAWPWDDIAVSDFAGGPNELFKTATLTRAQVEALGIDGAEQGMVGVALQSEGKLYTFALRPLLPDEIE